ncbi:hypothetical protein WICPIJ_009464 [Wickerhamomyces pijperi]|uniref:Uncharacterized protein n=1 Tax=Wickerhamomyces pijperi TaxID=599730 RepID=A0A9P8TD59_WICPI|nr:hypothetical protein WICPIJ_009464 [Wickerhamomyces pijperi]
MISNDEQIPKRFHLADVGGDIILVTAPFINSFEISLNLNLISGLLGSGTMLIISISLKTPYTVRSSRRYFPIPTIKNSRCLLERDEMVRNDDFRSFTTSFSSSSIVSMITQLTGLIRYTLDLKLWAFGKSSMDPGINCPFSSMAWYECLIKLETTKRLFVSLNVTQFKVSPMALNLNTGKLLDELEDLRVGFGGLDDEIRLFTRDKEQIHTVQRQFDQLSLNDGRFLVAVLRCTGDTVEILQLLQLWNTVDRILEQFVKDQFTTDGQNREDLLRACAVSQLGELDFLNERIWDQTLRVLKRLDGCQLDQFVQSGELVHFLVVISLKGQDLIVNRRDEEHKLLS